ncbi:MAG: gas vesicle protein K [Candidatus Zixiibacteriota bacterium]
MIDIDADNLKHGVLGLVVALVEVIRDALKIQAFKRMESGSLEEDEMERLGEALMDLDAAIEQIKKEQGLTQTVQSVRDGLDNIVDEVLDQMINPERWEREVDEKQMERV